MKTFAKIVFGLYVATLLWLVLFKFSYDLIGVLLYYQSRALNLIPFFGYSAGNVREMIDNVVVLVPFGLLLGVLFKQVAFWPKLAVIFGFSLAVEVLQFVFAIGVSDITDLIANTTGGAVGLGVYALGSNYIGAKKLDGFIVMTGGILLLALLAVRVLVLRVMY